jgi:hypothetical protein
MAGMPFGWKQKRTPKKRKLTNLKTSLVSTPGNETQRHSPHIQHIISTLLQMHFMRLSRDSDGCSANPSSAN